MGRVGSVHVEGCGGVASRASMEGAGYAVNLQGWIWLVRVIHIQGDGVEG